MAKWWTGAAVTALWFLHAAPARAQHPPPDAGPCMPEPLPFQAAPAMPPAGPPQFPAGPVSPLPAELALPANLPNAWDERYCNFPACYVFVGSTGLVRQRMGRGVVALTGPDTGDTGLPIDPTSGTAQTFHDIAPKLNWGVRATVGYHWDDQAVEVSGFYLFENDSDRLATSAGRLNTFFINQPVGFLGNTGLFRQSDVVRTGLQSTLASAEANYHWWIHAGGTFHWLARRPLPRHPGTAVDLRRRRRVGGRRDQPAVAGHLRHPRPQPDHRPAARFRGEQGDLPLAGL